MRTVGNLLITPVAASLAQFCNPAIRLSPVAVYGMQEPFAFADLAVIVLAVVVAKALLRQLWRPAAGKDGDSPERQLVWSALVSMVAISMVTLLLFLFTAIPCSPNFLILFGLFEWGLLIGGYLAESRIRRQPILGGWSGAALPVAFKVLAILAVGIPAGLAGLVWSYKKYPEVKWRVNIAQNLFQSRGEYRLEPVFGNLNFRQLVDFSIDSGTGDMFVLERAGRLFRVRNSREEKELVVDFRHDVGPPPKAELGAYSLKLHPAFKSGADERLYLFYTSRTENGGANKLVEIDLREGSDPGEIWDQRRTVLQFPATTGSHNSGALEFDEAGFLFVALGDAEKSEDSQILNGPLKGKILRIDPDKRGGTHSFAPRIEAGPGVIRDYYIPSENPFAGDGNIRGEIWAFGTRNPFRIRWEPDQGGLLVGDVGQLKWEELNLVRAGDNCGWPAYEGDEIYEPEWAERLEGDSLREPLHAYRHDALNRSVVGGFFYPQGGLPRLAGTLIAGDNFSGNIWSIEGNGRGKAVLLAKAPDFNQSGISRISEGPGGEIWVGVMGSPTKDTGAVFRLVKAEGGPDSPEPVRIARTTAEIFAVHCALCHGASGDGKGAMSHQFPLAMPDFSSPEWQRSVEDSHLRRAIAQGGAAVGKSPVMPAWESVFSDGEIDGLAAFVRDLGLNRLSGNPEGTPQRFGGDAFQSAGEE